MEVGTDESVVAISFDENSTGKTFSDTKVRYIWEVMVDGKIHRIEFTNTKTSGKKRIFVDGRLLHENSVFRSPNFQYSWPIGGHLLSIVPVKADGTDSIFDKVMDRMANSVDCQFELRINGLPFRAFRKKPARVVPVRPPRPADQQSQVSPFQPDREYLEMRAKVEELQSRPHRPQGIEAAVSSTGRRTSPWEAKTPASHTPAPEKARATKTAHGDPWKGTSPPTTSLTSPPRTFGDEEIGFTTGAGKYAGFTNSAGSSSEDDEEFTTYGTKPTEQWPPSSSFAWPGDVSAPSNDPWEAKSAPTSSFEDPPKRPPRQPIPTYAIPWSPLRQPPAAALPKATTATVAAEVAQVQQVASVASPSLTTLKAAPTRTARNLAQRQALLDSIGLGLSRRSLATPQALPSQSSGHFKWPEADARPSPSLSRTTPPRSSKLLADRKALLGSIGLAGANSNVTHKERKNSDIVQATVLAHGREASNGESPFPMVQGNVVNLEESTDTLSHWPEGGFSSQVSAESAQFPSGFLQATESPFPAETGKKAPTGWPEALQATEASSAVATGFPPSPGFPAASPAKESSSGGMQWPGTVQAATSSPGFPPSPGFPEASLAKETQASAMQWPNSLQATKGSPAVATGFPPSPGFPEASPAKDSGVPKEPSSGGMQWPGTAQAAVSSPGFPPSPGFPEASPAKETPASATQWPDSLPVEATEDAPAVASGFPPSPGFPEASPAKDSGVPKEPSSGGMHWPGTAQAAVSSSGFPPSPGFPEASPAKDPGVLQEPSSGGMQQPGTAQDEPLESTTGGANWHALPEAGSSSSEESSAEESLPATRPSKMHPEAKDALESGIQEPAMASGSSLIPEAKDSTAFDWPGTSQAADGFPPSFGFSGNWPDQESSSAWPDLTSSMAGFASSFPSPGFPDAPKQESASGGMQWPGTSMANSQEAQSFDAMKWPSSSMPSSAQVTGEPLLGPEEATKGAVNGHAETSDKVESQGPTLTLPTQMEPPKASAKVQPKFADDDEGEMPSWWPKGA